jgi:hypothetical protein
MKTPTLTWVGVAVAVGVRKVYAGWGAPVDVMHGFERPAGPPPAPVAGSPRQTVPPTIRLTEPVPVVWTPPVGVPTPVIVVV